MRASSFCLKSLSSSLVVSRSIVSKWSFSKPEPDGTTKERLEWLLSEKFPAKTSDLRVFMFNSEKSKSFRLLLFKFSLRQSRKRNR